MYTPEALEMAKNLMRSTQLQNRLMYLLREITQPVSYSNKDFDDGQALAALFTELQNAK